MKMKNCPIVTDKTINGRTTIYLHDNAKHSKVVSHRVASLLVAAEVAIYSPQPEPPQGTTRAAWFTQLRKGG
jgi:hypothetical protein